MASLIGIALWALIPGFIANKKGRSFWGYYFLSFLISPLITLIITLCLSNLSEDGEFETKRNRTVKSYFCEKCNSLLPNDSEFCQYCGNKIEKSIAQTESE